MDWLVVAGDTFLAISLAGLVVSPLIGTAGGWRHIGSVPALFIAGVFVGSFTLLAITWRHIPGGVLAALSGHLALFIAAAALTQLGRAIRMGLGHTLYAGLTGLLLATAMTIGPFALGPIMSDLPLSAYNWMLLANPLVTIATASGIDLLHVDLIYRLSPLAHRGVALPAWTSACIGYAVFGLASYGVSHLRLRSA